MPVTLRPLSSLLAAAALAAGFAVSGGTAAALPATLTITDNSWNVIGLDSNGVNDGPNVFEHGARVCNPTASEQVVDISWQWESANQYVNLLGPDSFTRTIDASACADVYFAAEVTRTPNAYGTTRSFTMHARGDAAPVTYSTMSSPLLVERLVSQNRNAILTPVTGPAAASVGDTVTFTLNAKTATQGYESVVPYLTFDPSVVEITAVSAAFAAPTGTTGDRFWADGCGWDPATNDGAGPPRVPGGKIGGNPITVTVTAKVVGAGTMTLNGVVYDFSGSSFHYNSDYGTKGLVFTATVPGVTAADDAATTGQGTSVEVAILDNDTAAGVTLDATTVTFGAAEHGTVDYDPATGLATFTPDAGFTGTATFTYTVCDTTGQYCSTAVVTVTVTPTTEPPTTEPPTTAPPTTEPPTTSPDTTGPDTTGADTTGPAAPTADAPAADGRLPDTGGSSSKLFAIGAFLSSLGAAVLYAARRKTTD
jgi:LPXTG-motif cell wall-anchored protein